MNNTPRYLLIEFSSAEEEQTDRDEGLLDSALSAPFQGFGDTDVFPSSAGTLPVSTPKDCYIDNF